MVKTRDHVEFKLGMTLYNVYRGHVSEYVTSEQRHVVEDVCVWTKMGLSPVERVNIRASFAHRQNAEWAIKHPHEPFPLPGFYAVLMSGPGWKRFSTHEEANAFIDRCRCNMCRDDMVCRPYETCFSCDAEWSVWDQADWNEFGPLPAEDEWAFNGHPLPTHKAGIICLWSTRGWALHLGVRPKYWHWGWTRDWYDYIGFGPFFLWARN